MFHVKSDVGSTFELSEMCIRDSHRLRFSLIPMVHWPETMVTFDETEGILFSGDA